MPMSRTSFLEKHKPLILRLVDTAVGQLSEDALQFAQHVSDVVRVIFVEFRENGGGAETICCSNLQSNGWRAGAARIPLCIHLGWVCAESTVTMVGLLWYSGKMSGKLWNLPTVLISR